MMSLAADVTSGRDVFLFKVNWVRGYNCCECAVQRASAGLAFIHSFIS